MYTAIFHTTKGGQFEKEFDCTNLEDATIEASNYAEENDLEFISIYEN